MTLLDHPEDTILGKTPLDDCSLPHKHHYLTTNNNHKRETYMSPAVFEVAILAKENHALASAATGISIK